jgi:hypothetical protein
LTVVLPICCPTVINFPNEVVPGRSAIHVRARSHKPIPHRYQPPKRALDRFSYSDSRFTQYEHAERVRQEPRQALNRGRDVDRRPAVSASSARFLGESWPSWVDKRSRPLRSRNRPSAVRYTGRLVELLDWSPHDPLPVSLVIRCSPTSQTRTCREPSAPGSALLLRAAPAL